MGKHLDVAKQLDWTNDFAARLWAITNNYREPRAAHELDHLVDRLVDCYIQATDSCMPDCKPRSSKAAQWWNEDCRRAAEEIRQAPRELKPKLLNRFHRVVRKAKQEWANGILESATPNNVWRLAGWSAGKHGSCIPPLITDDGIAVSAAELGETLKSAFFPPSPSQVEVAQANDMPGRPVRDFVPISIEEVSQALSSTSNASAPGPSEINYRLIKWSFPSCGHLLTSKHKLVPTNQFECRDKSLTIDAGITLMHDIQSGWKKGLTATALVFDIKGFFDHVHHGRLVEVLRLAGFPPQIRTWIQSFLSNRQVSIWINGSNTPPSPTSVGIPQGSPLSPILAHFTPAQSLNYRPQRTSLCSTSTWTTAC
ncbi:Muscle M-line assembly protein [Salix suchowensis]|nr:Muscle M-line assembly protein [Salix suchowensis]